MPPLDWTRRDGLAALVAALGAADCRYVGGCVRDALAGTAARDIDIATRHLPEEVMLRLQSAGIRTIPTGIEHGTITALLTDGPVEVTTLRRDVVTDGRHAVVAFTCDWQEDAARRDFTINALYADPATHEITDYFGGLDDLAAHKVRFIGDAHARIAEDHLRILRFFRFQARFGSEPADAEALAACSQGAPMLMALSRERVGAELTSLLGLADPVATVRLMSACGVLPTILPSAGPTQLDTLVVLVAGERDADVAPDAMRRLVALLPDERQAALQAASRLRLSNAQKKRIACAVEAGDVDGSHPRALAYRLGMQCAVDRLLLCGKSIAPLRNWQAPRLPVGGRDLMALGVDSGPQIARILKTVEQCWIEEGFPDEARTREILAAQLGSGVA
ncbi:CCA tRNA nucleotidyltransferase [Croceicoccus sp. F390]|uniref:CCA tRNA nucleotidyltransferase n=1 Tax=Croceicoccus esteveae TaxID=3075597 RepID=A0ABU2ZEH3_9SPHN|nr:CCA tRNA nucleotidyltransferase [Croceicoccus sp. F390]MDT0575005.1 CCA tRNA nucleotidyltransferase [Croceicoccus sp. F390]